MRTNPAPVAVYKPERAAQLPELLYSGPACQQSTEGGEGKGRFVANGQ